MEIEFATLLRQLRQKQGLTQQQVARSSEIGRVTLNRWETGAQLPHIPELQAVMQTLGLDARDRNRLLQKLDVHRGRATLLQDIQRIQNQLNGFAVPHGGNVLRALRTRRHLSLTEVARRVGVSERTVHRWEHGDTWPSLSHLHALCYATRASEEEMVTLTSADFSLSLQTKPEASVWEIDRQEDNLKRRAWKGELALIDLHFLALEAQCCRVALHNDYGRYLLSRACFSYAATLCLSERWREARREVERALQVLPKTVRLEYWMVHLQVTVACCVAHTSGSRWGLSSLRRLNIDAQWLPLRAWANSESARFMAEIGSVEPAVELSKLACEEAERTGWPKEGMRRRLNYAQLLVRHSDNPARALDVLEGVEGDNPWTCTNIALCRTRGFIATGNRSEAHICLQDAMALVDRYDLSNWRDEVHTLSLTL